MSSERDRIRDLAERVARRLGDGGQGAGASGEEFGATVLALDSVDSGEGDLVIVVQEGWGASTAATGETGAAIDSAIVGVVDRVDLLADEAG